jgi:hypothetical protein
MMETAVYLRRRPKTKDQRPKTKDQRPKGKAKRKGQEERPREKIKRKDQGVADIKDRNTCEKRVRG